MALSAIDKPRSFDLAAAAPRVPAVIAAQPAHNAAIVAPRTSVRDGSRLHGLITFMDFCSVKERTEFELVMSRLMPSTCRGRGLRLLLTVR
jgi:hypothetical protein